MIDGQKLISASNLFGAQTAEDMVSKLNGVPVVIKAVLQTRMEEIEKHIARLVRFSYLRGALGALRLQAGESNPEALPIHIVVNSRNEPDERWLNEQITRYLRASRRDEKEVHDV